MLKVMKKFLLGLFVLVMLSSCNEDDALPTGCIEVKVLDMFCGQAIMQIQDPDYYYLGETANGYENVFFTYPHCVDSGRDLSENVLIELTDDKDKGGCAVCLAILPYDGERIYHSRIRDFCD